MALTRVTAGSGGFATVKQATSKDDGREVSPSPHPDLAPLGCCTSPYKDDKSAFAPDGSQRKRPELTSFPRLDQVAIKIIEKERIRDHVQQVFRQNTLMTLKHPHIIELIEWFESKSHYFLVFELASGGELFDHLIESPNCR